MKNISNATSGIVKVCTNVILTEYSAIEYEEKDLTPCTKPLVKELFDLLPVKKYMHKPQESNQSLLFIVSRDGGYSSWTPWTKCSTTCEAGTMSRSRACDNPHPQGTGKDCARLGVGLQTIPCFSMDCPSK